MLRSRSGASCVIAFWAALHSGCSRESTESGAGGASTGGASSTAGSSSTGGGASGGGAGAGGAAGQSANDGGTGSGVAGSSPGDAPSRLVTFEPSTEILLNPERGFYTTAELTSPGDLSSVRAQGKTLLYAAVHLDEYLGTNHEQDLPQQVLDDVAAGFAAIRDARLKAVVRFQYDDGEGYPGGANDAPETWIVKHLAQLAPVLQDNEDVLFLLQAGLIGAWGEWHTSQNFEDGSADQVARKNVVDALLTALPKTRRTALRYPAYKRMFYGTAPTSEADLLADNDLARAGHLNDCFVSGDDDVGTYQYESMEILKGYLEEDTKYVPIGGETCAVHARNSCSTTLSEMERFHWTYINDDYHPDVLGVWETEGCREDIERRLGYRLSLASAELPDEVRPGGTFTLHVTLDNGGFAAFTNPRPVFVVLDSGAVRLSAQLTADPRTWLPGATTLVARLRVPAELSPGDYRLALWLPDAAPGLQAYPEYSVRFANVDTWHADSGDNTLAQITVSPDAPGNSDPSASSFEVIP